MQPPAKSRNIKLFLKVWSILAKTFLKEVRQKEVDSKSHSKTLLNVESAVNEIISWKKIGKALKLELAQVFVWITNVRLDFLLILFFSTARIHVPVETKNCELITSQLKSMLLKVSWAWESNQLVGKLQELQWFFVSRTPSRVNCRIISSVCEGWRWC